MPAHRCRLRRRRPASSSQVSTGNADGFDSAGMLNVGRKASVAGRRPHLHRLRYAVDVDRRTRRRHRDHARDRHATSPSTTKAAGSDRYRRPPAASTRAARTLQERDSSAATAIATRAGRETALLDIVSESALCVEFYQAERSRGMPTLAARASSPVAPQRVQRRQRGQRRGLGAQHSRAQPHRGEAGAQRGAVSSGARPPSGPTRNSMPPAGRVSRTKRLRAHRAPTATATTRRSGTTANRRDLAAAARPECDCGRIVRTQKSQSAANAGFAFRRARHRAA